MQYSDTNIDRAAGFSRAALSPSLAAFSLVAVAARVLAAIGTRRGIDGALNDRRGRLGLNLWNRLSRVLRERRRQHRWLERRNVHNELRLIPVNTMQFWHRHGEETVNFQWINTILNKTSQTTLFHAFLDLGVQS